MEDNNWEEWGDVALKNDTYYELAFWEHTKHFVEIGKVDGRFINQGILQYNDGFRVDGYWLRPTPTHIREIKLTTPSLELALENEKL